MGPASWRRQGCSRASPGSRRRNLTLVNRVSTYAHNDPALGDPKKDTFVKQLVPYLKSVAAR